MIDQDRDRDRSENGAEPLPTAVGPLPGAGRCVLIIVQNLPVPFDRRVWLEATTLQRCGFQVSVICPKMKGWNRSHELIEQVEIYRYPLPIEARSSIGYVAEFAWCLACASLLSAYVMVRGRGFDVLHACNPPDTYWLLGRVWKLFGKRFIFDHHDLAPEVYEAKFRPPRRTVLRALHFLERQTFKTADVVITTNHSQRRVAIVRGRVAPDRVYVVRSGPDLRRFCLLPRESSWRQGKEHLIAYLGEIGTQDGVDILVEALHALRHQFGREDFHCVLIGGGPHARSVRDHAYRLGLAGLSTFTGDVQNDHLLCRILSSADVAVVPDPKTAHSDASTMNKVVEYMFFGLPIVAFDLAENRVSAAEAALYVPASSPHELARHLSQLLDDRTLRARMGAIGRQRVSRELAWEYSVPHLLSAYSRVFDTGASRPCPSISS